MKSSTRAAAQLGELNKNKGEQMNELIDPTNLNMVSINSVGDIMILNPPPTPISKERALVLAAWIVTLACSKEGEFEKYLDAVMST